MSTFTIIEDYRETKTEQVPTVTLDDQALINGLQALGVNPLFVDTDGRKLRVHFKKEECQPVYVLMQKALVGIFPSDPIQAGVLQFFAKHTQAEAGWRAKLAMMRNYRVD